MHAGWLAACMLAHRRGAGELSLPGVQAYLLQAVTRSEKAQSTASRPQPLQGQSAPPSQTMEHVMDTVVEGLAKVVPSSIKPIMCTMDSEGTLRRGQDPAEGFNAELQAPAGDYPPYPVWGGNEYQGWLWTMENDKFDRSDVRACTCVCSACLTPCQMRPASIACRVLLTPATVAQKGQAAPAEPHGACACRRWPTGRPTCPGPACGGHTFRAAPSSSPGTSPCQRTAPTAARPHLPPRPMLKSWRTLLLCERSICRAAGQSQFHVMLCIIRLYCEHCL